MLSLFFNFCTLLKVPDFFSFIFIPAKETKSISNLQLFTNKELENKFIEIHSIKKIDPT